MAYNDDIQRTTASLGSPEGSVNPRMWGDDTLSFAGKNHPSNTETASNRNSNTPAEYGKTKTNVTASGHVLQFNDTPAGERVLLKHNTGSAVDMLPDGSVEISSRGNMSITINKDGEITISGNMKFAVNGDLDLDVRGNFNVDCLNYNLKVEGNQVETIGGSSRSTITGNQGTNIKGNSSTTTLGTTTNISLGDMNVVSKGATKVTAQGDLQIASGGKGKVSSQGGLDVSSTNINIAGNSTTVVGATGTFGGAGVVVYGKGANFTEGVTAPTFHGALNGNANTATQAGRAGTAGAIGAGGSAGTVVNVASPSTALPNGALMTQYLTASSKGILQVEVDRSEDLLKMLDRTVFTGGLSKNDMTTKEVRSALRDPANASNQEFIQGQIAAGNLSPTYSSSVPTGVSGASSAAPGGYQASPDIGAQSPGWIQPGAKVAKRSFMPDATHHIGDNVTITEKFELWSGIPLSTFLKG